MLRTPHIRMAATLAVALATIGPTAASARPIEDKPAGSASLQAPSQPTGVPPIVAAPKPSQLAALRQAQRQARLAYLYRPNSARYSGAELNAYATPAAVPSTVVHFVSRDGRFDWGDAGIGAAGGLGLALVGLGGAFAISQQRQTRRSKRSAPIAS